MKGKIRVLRNEAELAQANKLGITAPAVEYSMGTLFFAPQSVYHFCALTDEQDNPYLRIVISPNYSYDIEFDEQIYDILSNVFADR